MSQGSAMRPGGAALGGRALVAGGLAFELAKKWWVLLLRGILLIIIGLLAFVSPLVWLPSFAFKFLATAVPCLWPDSTIRQPEHVHGPLVFSVSSGSSLVCSS